MREQEENYFFFFSIIENAREYNTDGVFFSECGIKICLGHFFPCILGSLSSKTCTVTVNQLFTTQHCSN